MKKRALGKSGIEVPAIGTGTAAWGFPMMGYGKAYSKQDLFDAYTYLLDKGLNWFDTSENYANGESERLLGEFRERDGRDIIVATKWDRTKDPGNLFSSLDGSLARLRADNVDLLQLHYPPKRGITVETMMDAMAEAVKRGKAKAIGVSNFNAELMKRACDRLAHHHLPLASNEVYYNVLERRAEFNGVWELCHKYDIALIAYSPMAQGALTGKFRSGDEGKRRLTAMQRMYFRFQQLDLFRERADAESLLSRLWRTPRASNLKKLEPLFVKLDEIAGKYNASIPQVVLNALLAADPRVLPIPGVKNLKQARDNAGALAFDITKEEYGQIIAAASQTK